MKALSSSILHTPHSILIASIVLAILLPVASQAQNRSFRPGEIWPDTDGVHINAHGGGILAHDGKYYWFGEHKGTSNNALVGVTCYSSSDLYNWKNEGVALSVAEDDPESPIVKGCIIERPKVIYNRKTGKFVMYFHLELKGRGYAAAQVGVAVSDKVTGPYSFLRASRVNPGKWPANMSETDRKNKIDPAAYEQWWTPEWTTAVHKGLFIQRDLPGGQMSRDMTLYVDDDGKAYHIYASEENLTLQIAELSDDYTTHTGKYIRVEPAGHNEAPAIFKRGGRYFMITSGCTGWAPNAARLLSSDHIMGEWKLHPNPCIGEGADLTFHSQSTYILPVQGKKEAFIFMADRWRPQDPIDGRYVWLPIQFRDGLPVLTWFDEWDLNTFDLLSEGKVLTGTYPGWKMVWNEEFDYEGEPDPEVWSHENGFVRNEEFQWYQPANAHCEGGMLVITGKKERKENPRYSAGSGEWRRNREYAEYTASSIKTQGKKEFLYGRFEIRAKIPTAGGAWPAIWTLGNQMEWPSCGEIDIMEYYRIQGVPHILANTAWGTNRRYHGAWNTSKIPFEQFTAKDPNWADNFHVWRMDWDEEYIRLYLDDELLNETPLDKTFNGDLGERRNPFRQPHYLLLNLAIGGVNGGIPDDTAFPMTYEIDYVRVYQKVD